ncbi:MAG: hypothetical protein ABII12_13735 [Planctomycetota bacterium]
MNVTDDKSRHEMITRAKISYAEQKTNMSMQAWIDRELREIGFDPITEQEVENYGLLAHPRIF